MEEEIHPGFALEFHFIISIRKNGIKIGLLGSIEGIDPSLCRSVASVWNS